jgi:hypothetical protein
MSLNMCLGLYGTEAVLVCGMGYRPTGAAARVRSLASPSESELSRVFVLSFLWGIRLSRSSAKGDIVLAVAAVALSLVKR